MMKQVFSILLTLLFCQSTRADYALPASLEAADPGITSVVDATVTEITKEGYAVIKVHHFLKKGKVEVKTIKGVSLTCTPGIAPKEFGVKSGKRYLMILAGDLLYEERSWFEISAKDGERGCKLHEPYRKWFDAKEEWMSLKSCEKKLQAVAEKAKKLAK